MVHGHCSSSTSPCWRHTQQLTYFMCCTLLPFPVGACIRARKTYHLGALLHPASSGGAAPIACDIPSGRERTTMCYAIRIRIHLGNRRRPLALLSCVHNYTSTLVTYGLQSSSGAVTGHFQRPTAHIACVVKTGPNAQVCECCTLEPGVCVNGRVTGLCP
ncbi:hypothetical protein EDD16DRAFT_1106910 [Pisolithus croceorrhizus]|nr:hypothetical protein EDD16DRAFT_1106910 [Pisolithus croceorrhizus]